MSDRNIPPPEERDNKNKPEKEKEVDAGIANKFIKIEKPLGIKPGIFAPIDKKIVEKIDNKIIDKPLVDKPLPDKPLFKKK